MKTARLVTYALSSLFIISCGVPQADFDKLKEENEKLKKEIAECELTPPEMLEQANEYYTALEYTKSRDRLKILIAKYANSNEGKKAKSILKKVENAILKTARESSTEKKTNIDEVSEAEDELEKESKESAEKHKKALAKMSKKYDINDHVTWYSDKSATQSNTKNYVQTYIGKKEKKPWLGLSINYFSKKKWLSIERIEITVDGNTFEIEEDKPGEFKSKEESGGKREWLDRIIKRKDMQLIKKIAAAKIAKIKFVGEDDVYKRTITKTEKKSIKNVLDAFVALGGNTD